MPLSTRKQIDTRKPIGNLKQIATRKQKGFSLIEILVSVLILAIGLLGLASMQTNGLQKNRDAYFRTQATILAQDMIDRMRANPDQAGAYLMGMSTSSASSRPTACTGSSSCGASAMAAADVAEWLYNLKEQLPAGSGSVTDKNNDAYEITVQWSGSETDAAVDGSEDSIVLGLQL